ncbi:MAG: hypothetical protein FWH20_00225 [Oscillospiraceae bacterium]|nr:hypothetical protein [Oscillospiraceae bacterium]
MNNKILLIARTGVLIALLVALQWGTGSLTAAAPPPFNTLVTGSVVNLILIVSVMTGGLACGAAVAVLSPVMAFMLPIPVGPQFPFIIPFVCLGNLTLVALWHVIGNKAAKKVITAHITALIAGALGKFAVLYVGVVLVAIPFLLDLTPQQATMITTMFSYPQIITAAIGGAIAIAILPVLKKATRS